MESVGGKFLNTDVEWSSCVQHRDEKESGRSLLTRAFQRPRTLAIIFVSASSRFVALAHDNSNRKGVPCTSGRHANGHNGLHMSTHPPSILLHLCYHPFLSPFLFHTNHLHLRQVCHPRFFSRSAMSTPSRTAPKGLQPSPQKQAQLEAGFDSASQDYRNKIRQVRSLPILGTTLLTCADRSLHRSPISSVTPKNHSRVERRAHSQFQTT